MKSNIQPPVRRKKSVITPENKSIWDYLTASPYVYLLIFLFIFLIYGQILSFFLGKLDEPDILLVNMPFLKDFANLKKVFSTDAFFSARNCTFYRPMQNISFMVDAHLSGTDAWGYYLTNMLIHGITCTLIFHLLTLLGNEKKGALMLALFFAASPAFVHAIAWAPSRGDLLTGMFGILSFIFFIRFARSKNYLFLAIHLVSLVAALFSKETAILFPVLFFLYYAFIEKERKVTTAGLILPLVLNFLAIGLFLFMRSRVVTLPVPSTVFGILPLMNNLRMIPESLSKFFLPFHLSPMPAYSLFHTLAGLVMIGVLAIVGLKYLSVPIRWAAFGFFWFLLFTLPGMLYSHPMGTSAYGYMEHRFYLPMTGILIILYFMLLQVHNLKHRQFVYFYLFLASIAYGTYAHFYSGYYENPVTFYNRVFETNPNSAVAWYNRGEINILHEKDYQGAMEDFDHAVKIKPDYAKAFVNRGICKEFTGDTLGALNDCKTGAKFSPGLFIAHKNIAVMSNQVGLKAEALKEWDIALNLSPDYFQGYNERGVIKYQLNDFSAAEKDFNLCIKINGRYPEAYLNRGMLFHRINDLDNACNDWRTAAGLGSENAVDLLHAYCGNQDLLP